MTWITIPREVGGRVDLATIYVAVGDEYRVTVSTRMAALGIPNSPWVPVTSAMVGMLIGAEIDPCIEVRRNVEVAVPKPDSYRTLIRSTFRRGQDPKSRES